MERTCEFERRLQALLAGTPGFSVEDVQRELRGRDLACWCPLDQPCHADVLLEIANCTTVNQLRKIADVAEDAV